MDKPYMDKLCRLMKDGSPVVVRLSEKEGEFSDLLFCQLVQKARHGESFRIEGQGCSVGNFVLGRSDEKPDGYYMKSGRYRDMHAARTATGSIPRLPSGSYRSIEIKPLGQDIILCDGQGECETGSVILFLEPAKAMLLIQAFSYHRGERITCTMGGVASVCGDCFVYPLTTGGISVSAGCRGSRKHSMYPDSEMVVSIPFLLVPLIEECLGRIG